MEPLEISSAADNQLQREERRWFGHLCRIYDWRFLFVFGLQYFNAGLHLAFFIAYQYMYKTHYKVSPGESNLY